MTQSPVSVDKKTTDTPEASPVKHPALLLTATALDTTWRVIFPGLVGVVGGLLLDKAWHTTPWVMIVGIVLGVALSAYLVYRQLKTVK
jgi:F0F1-type ATP synthase assembly protein I